MNFIKRIKKMWKLSKKDPDVLEEFMKLSDKEIMDLPDEDTKAIYIGLGDEKEYIEFENEKKFGVKNIFNV